MSMRAAAADNFIEWVNACGIIRHQNRYLGQKILRIFVLGRSLQIEVAGGAL